MTAGRAALVAVAVLTVGLAGGAAGTPDRGPAAPVDTSGESRGATTPAGTATQEHPPPDNNSSTIANDSTAAATADPIRGLSTGSAIPETGSGVIVVDQHGRLLLRAFVVLNCSTLAVTATPERRPYSLSMVFVGDDTGRRQELHAGPLNGTVTDPFGRTDLTLVRVDLRFLGRVVLTRVIPEWCGWPTAGSTASPLPAGSTAWWPFFTSTVVAPPGMGPACTTLGTACSSSRSSSS